MLLALIIMVAVGFLWVGYSLNAIVDLLTDLRYQQKNIWTELERVRVVTAEIRGQLPEAESGFFRG